jgi:undecaprenyl pyrophosphate synthase
MKIYLENFLGFDRMHKNKIYIFFLGEINSSFENFFKNYFEENQVF